MRQAVGMVERMIRKFVAFGDGSLEDGLMRGFMQIFPDDKERGSDRKRRKKIQQARQSVGVDRIRTWEREIRNPVNLRVKAKGIEIDRDGKQT